MKLIYVHSFTLLLYHFFIFFLNICMRERFIFSLLMNIVDKEELRTDKAVEVSRKEQYDLIAELLELTPMFSMQEEEQEVFKKKKLPDNETPPIENNNMVRKTDLCHVWQKICICIFSRFIVSLYF